MSNKEEVIQQITKAVERLAYGAEGDDVLFEAVESHAERMLKEPWAVKEIERTLKRELKLALQDRAWSDELFDALYQTLGDSLVKELTKRVKLVIE